MGFFKSDSQIINTSPDTLAKILSENPLTCVLFFSPGCGYCQQFSPECDRLADKLADENIPIHLVAIDCSKYSDFSKKLGVQGYPTMRFYSGTKNYHEYNGERKADAILSQLLELLCQTETELEVCRNYSKPRTQMLQQSNQYGAYYNNFAAKQYRNPKLNRCTDCGLYRKPR